MDEYQDTRDFPLEEERGMRYAKLQQNDCMCKGTICLPQVLPLVVEQ